MAGYERSKRYRELFKKPGSSVWWAFLPNPAGGRMLRESTGLREERAAHSWYLKRISSYGPAVVSSKERTLRDALAGRVEWLKAARKSNDPTRKKPAQATIEFYDKKSAPLLHILGRDTLLSSIGHEEIRRYIVARSASAKATTIAKELTTLSMAMRLARKDGVSAPVFKDILPEDFRAVYVPKTRWLPEDEVDALVFGDELPPERAAVVAFIVATSATYPSEVAPVRPSMIDMATYTVHLPGTKRATRNRTLRVPSHARKYLDFAVKYLGKNGFKPWPNIRKGLARAAERLSRCPSCCEACRLWGREGKGRMPTGRCPECLKTKPFPTLCPTDLRRTFVQWLVRSGVPNELVAPMAGHVDTKMVQKVYGKRDATSVAELVELALEKAPSQARCQPGASQQETPDKQRQKSA